MNASRRRRWSCYLSYTKPCHKCKFPSVKLMDIISQAKGKPDTVSGPSIHTSDLIAITDTCFPVL